VEPVSGLTRSPGRSQGTGRCSRPALWPHTPRLQRSISHAGQPEKAVGGRSCIARRATDSLQAGPLLAISASRQSSCDITIPQPGDAPWPASSAALSSLRRRYHSSPHGLVPPPVPAAAPLTPTRNQQQNQSPTDARPQHHYTVQSQPAAGTCHYRHTGGQPLPDPACTPGALNPHHDHHDHLPKRRLHRLTPRRRVRPPHQPPTRRRPQRPTQPLGRPPGHKPEAGPNNPKDAVETHLHTAICKGTITLTAAQHAIATNWTAAESALGIAR